jgi:chromate transporter
MTGLLLLAWTFFRLSFLCMGGGLAAVAEMERQSVGYGWLTARQFVDGYALSRITPGPAMLVTVFIGYRAAGILGALVATAAMFIPTAVCAWVVARRWERLRGHPWAVAVERALAPVAIGLMASGVYTITRSAVTDLPSALLAIAAGIALARHWVPAVALVLGAGLLIWLLGF